jgi:hypothetical protein
VRLDDVVAGPCVDPIVAEIGVRMELDAVVPPLPEQRSFCLSTSLPVPP